MYTVHNVYSSQWIQFTKCTLYNVYTVQCVHCTMFTLYNVYTVQCAEYSQYINTALLCTFNSLRYNRRRGSDLREGYHTGLRWRILTLRPESGAGLSEIQHSDHTSEGTRNPGLWPQLKTRQMYSSFHLLHPLLSCYLSALLLFSCSLVLQSTLAKLPPCRGIRPALTVCTDNWIQQETL